MTNTKEYRLVGTTLKGKVSSTSPMTKEEAQHMLDAVTKQEGSGRYHVEERTLTPWKQVTL